MLNNLNLYIIKAQKELARLFAESVANMVSLLLCLQVLYFRFPIKVFILERKCVCVCVYTLGVMAFLKEAMFFFTQYSGNAPFWRIRILEVYRILEIT